MDEGWELEFGSNRPQSVEGVLREVVDGRMSERMTDNQRAAAAWYRCNGKRERAHTMGVFLKRPRVRGAAPILGVYVDSHSMVTDFGVNKDIYLARLANVGFAVSGIEFVVSRTQHRAVRRDREEKPAQPGTLPALSLEERQVVESLVANLPESIRASASKAVSLSKRRDKLKNSDV